MTSHYKLRRWQRGDEASLVKYANNYDIWRNVRDGFPHPYTWENAHEWIKICEREETATVLAIEINGEAVGGVGIVPQKDIYRKNAEIGYWLGEPFWGRGIMTAAVVEMCAYAFAHFDIQRLYAGVFEYNIASMHVLKKAGFEQTSVFKKWLFKEGKFWDNHWFVKERTK
ncbi:MAG: N-acetyltransferase [Cytophagia bacterium]|nr:MAG: N-acetyltransferase [Runella sp.]TAG17531.1 MAG: N-acetyltransferase [Cytophagales bacterium]TAG36504.1 MAG: N-acetyltransferase [Cytophagia bacterium]TAG62969.1 MAG: N-acetyltransferase [Runella slithyformis]TAG78091.1 MAG: N-acetyltransferase [Cytophagales bacterium]